MVNKNKNKISFVKVSASLVSFFVFFTPIILFAIGPNDRLITCGAIDGSQPACSFVELLNTANNIIEFLLVYFATPLAAIIFAYAGFIYMFSGGSSTQVSKAKTMMKNMVIGYVIALSAWIIVKTILTSLGYTGTMFI